MDDIDIFASAALTGLLANSHYFTARDCHEDAMEDIVEAAYRFAEAAVKHSMFVKDPDKYGWGPEEKETS